uniref:Uncharacterized protein n=1 Tax=Anguilla anguilla TaxID=7936 RepID=A0A0E9TZA3_ANGAN
MEFSVTQCFVFKMAFSVTHSALCLNWIFQ